MSGFNLVQTVKGGVALLEAASSAVGSLAMSLAFPVSRGATNTVIVGSLPANAVITGITVVVPVVSNAATTATVSVGLSGGSATAFTAAQDVKTAIGTFQQAATAGWAVTPAAQTITATYTETGTASTAGSAQVAVNYVVI